MNNRFEVQERGVTETYYAVIDTRHEEFNMSEEAVTIMFTRQITAKTVCDLMNVEWTEFLRATSI